MTAPVFVAAVTARRDAGLDARLPEFEARLPADRRWLASNAERLSEILGVGAFLVWDESEYEGLTGRPLPPNVTGEVDHGEEDDERPVPLLYVGPGRCGDRATALRVLAHEFCHVRWRHLNHRAEFFVRVQRTLDTLAGATS